MIFPREFQLLPHGPLGREEPEVPDRELPLRQDLQEDLTHRAGRADYGHLVLLAHVLPRELDAARRGATPAMLCVDAGRGGQDPVSGVVDHEETQKLEILSP